MNYSIISYSMTDLPLINSINRTLSQHKCMAPKADKVRTLVIIPLSNYKNKL